MDYQTISRKLDGSIEQVNYEFNEAYAIPEEQESQSVDEEDDDDYCEPTEQPIQMRFVNTGDRKYVTGISSQQLTQSTKHTTSPLISSQIDLPTYFQQFYEIVTQDKQRKLILKNLLKDYETEEEKKLIQDILASNQYLSDISGLWELFKKYDLRKKFDEWDLIGIFWQR
eukprot:403339458